MATLLALLNTETSDGRVTLRWHSTAAARLRSTVERRGAGTEQWSVRGTPLLVGSDVLSFTETDLAPGRYEYRLRYFDDGSERLSEVVEIEIVAEHRLALAGFRPNPAIGRASLAFSLPDDRPARLELFDVKGRVVSSREVGDRGAGTHVVSLEDPLRAGVYWIRLTHPERTLVTKGLVVR